MFCTRSVVQVKDVVNAGSLQYKKGKVEFENVYFSYVNGSVPTRYDGMLFHDVTQCVGDLV